MGKAAAPDSGKAFLNYFYGQDAWRATDTLTVNYGLSYSIDTPMYNNQYGGEGITCLNPGVESKVFTNAPFGVAYPGEALATMPAWPQLVIPSLGLDLVSRGLLIWRNFGQAGAVLYSGRLRHLLQPYRRRIVSADPSDSAIRPHTVRRSRLRRHSVTCESLSDIDATGTQNDEFPYKFPTTGETISPETWGAWSRSTSAPTILASVRHMLRISSSAWNASSRPRCCPRELRRLVGAAQPGDLEGNAETRRATMHVWRASYTLRFGRSFETARDPRAEQPDPSTSRKTR